MTVFDEVLSHWRTSVALREIPEGVRVLDIGCGEGQLLRRAVSKGATGVGIDRMAPSNFLHSDRIEVVKGGFPEDLPSSMGEFDVIAGLAVLEHIPEAELDSFLAAVRDRITPGGRVVLTVPSHHVDAVLHLLIRLGVLDGMSHEEHHGFRVKEVIPRFERASFVFHRHRRFQLGLNNLFVFRAS